MEKTRKSRAAQVSNFILISVGFGFIYWFIECLIDVFIFYEGNRTLNVLTHGNFTHRLLTRLSSPDANEVLMRLLVLLAFVVFGAFVQHTVTGRNRAERKLKQLNEELEERVKERTTQLRAANQELQAFNYTVSHDLRAPLRAVHTSSRMLLEAEDDALADTARKRVCAIRDNVARMSQLIDDLLAFSRSARRDVQQSEVDVGELAQVVFNELKAGMPDREVTLEVKDAPTTTGDLSMLWEAMCNLLSNAMKFTRGQDPARVEVGGWSENGSSQCVYYVKDNGVGFDPKHTDRLFNVFQRLHSDDEFEGTGVGLAIVQRIIERHGGKIWAEGAKGQGATFYFSLPAPKA
jgi:two-component system sensor kinase